MRIIGHIGHKLSVRTKFGLPELLIVMCSLRNSANNFASTTLHSIFQAVRDGKQMLYVLSDIARSEMMLADY